MVVTAVRRSEAIFAKGEFDLDSEKPTWTVPWQRTKIGADAGTSYRAAAGVSIYRNSPFGPCNQHGPLRRDEVNL